MKKKEVVREHEEKKRLNGRKVMREVSKKTGRVKKMERRRWRKEGGKCWRVKKEEKWREKTRKKDKIDESDEIGERKRGEKRKWSEDDDGEEAVREY